jgi:acetolactate synthase-1/2/3 large subunit
MPADAERPARAGTRTGGSLVVESLEALGTRVVFGLPGTHVLPIWEGLRTRSLRYVGLRTELTAGFAADGYARAGGEPAVLLLTTGPGALMALAALMESSSAHVPVVAIAGQIPRELIGRGRDYLHELRDQRASFEPVVKWTATVGSADAIPDVVAEAWRRAQSPPSGPVFVEIPVDLLEARLALPAIEDIDATPPPPPLPPADVLDEAARLLNEAGKPVIWAGGGVLRSGAWAELRALAERLRAPVAMTYMGKAAFPADHELSAGSACDEAAFQELLSGATVVLCVGTKLGAETTAQYSLELPRLIHVDADAERIGKTYPALGLVGDARATLRALGDRVSERERDGAAEARVASVRARIERGLAGQGRELERGILAAVRNVLPRDGVSAWDMTILAYWAAAHFPVSEPRRFLYPLGSGTLGYAWPASLGAAAANGDGPTLAVVGDGGFLYGDQELAAARQYGLRTTLLLVDDGGYGVLRKHQREQFGETYGVDLEQPDFASLVGAFGVPVEQTTPDELADALGRAFAVNGPAVVHLPAHVEMWSPTS